MAPMCCHSPHRELFQPSPRPIHPRQAAALDAATDAVRDVANAVEDGVQVVGEAMGISSAEASSASESPAALKQ